MYNNKKQCVGEGTLEENGLTSQNRSVIKTIKTFCFR